MGHNFEASMKEGMDNSECVVVLLSPDYVRSRACCFELKQASESGKPIIVPFGESAIERRKATITRATWLERKWTKMTGDLEFMELLEFSFSGEELS